MSCILRISNEHVADNQVIMCAVLPILPRDETNFSNILSLYGRCVLLCTFFRLSVFSFSRLVSVLSLSLALSLSRSLTPSHPRTHTLFSYRHGSVMVALSFNRHTVLCACRCRKSEQSLIDTGRIFSTSLHRYFLPIYHLLAKLKQWIHIYNITFYILRVIYTIIERLNSIHKRIWFQSVIPTDCRVSMGDETTAVFVRVYDFSICIIRPHTHTHCQIFYFSISYFLHMRHMS